MAGAGGSAALAALVLLWCCSRGVSAGKHHFVERVIQSHQEQEQWNQGPPPNTDQFVAASASAPRKRLPRIQLPPTLGDALSKALSYEANRSRLRAARWRSRSRQESGADGRSSDRGDNRVDYGSGSRSSGETADTWAPVEEPWSDVPTSDPESAEAGRAHPRMPPLLRSALDTALYPGSESDPSAHQPPQSLDGALFSGSESDTSIHQPRHSPYINITETPQGCSCSGLTTDPHRTLSFSISHLPNSGRLDLHLPVISDPYSPSGPATLATRLALCPPGSSGRSVTASLRLKKSPRRREWRHAIISDWLAQLRRRSAVVEGQGQCLQVVLPRGGRVVLDRSGYRLAHLTTRPSKYRGR